MIILRSLTICLALSFLSACSLTATEQQCKDLRDSGYIYATSSSCVKCIDTLGPSDLDAIKGCSTGLDAAALVGQMK